MFLVHLMMTLRVVPSAAFTMLRPFCGALSWRPLMSYTASVWKFLSAFTPWMAVAYPVDTLLAAFTTVPSL